MKNKRLLLLFLSVLLLGCNETDMSSNAVIKTTADSVTNNESLDEDYEEPDEYILDGMTFPGRIKIIQEHLDSFLKSEIEDENLEPYRNIVEKKFYILDVHFVMAGGVYFKIIFPHYPHDEFIAVTGIDVDDNDSITAYHLYEIKRKGE